MSNNIFHFETSPPEYRAGLRALIPLVGIKTKKKKNNISKLLFCETSFAIFAKN